MRRARAIERLAQSPSIAASTRGGEIGRSAKRFPVAAVMAFATHASGGTIGASPTPRTPYGCRGIRHLDDHRVDHREIRRHRHAVVEEARVLDHAVLVEDVLLVERPADPLDRATLHLTLDIARVNGLAGVLNRRVAEHRDLAGFRIDLDVTQVCREARAGHGGVQGGLGDE